MLRVLLLALAVLAAASAGGTNKVVYGDDDRREPYAVESTIGKRTMRSVAVIISNFVVGDKGWLIPIAEEPPVAVCEEEPYRSQPAPGHCTAFLVAPDVVATAGHCISSRCNPDDAFVFDYAITVQGREAPRSIPPQNWFTCKEIISYGLNGDMDFGLVRLNREVPMREPLPLGRGHPDIDTPLAMAGHPYGLPLKYVDGATVVEAKAVAFTANLDAYGGNSGSPVIDASTGMVEGILVSGQTDFVFDEERLCMKSNVCSMEEGCSTGSGDGDLGGFETVASVSQIADRLVCARYSDHCGVQELNKICNVTVLRATPEVRAFDDGSGMLWYTNGACNTWLIRAEDPDATITVEFTDIDIEDHETCNYDAVVLFNGWAGADVDNLPDRITPICGQGVNPADYKFTSAGNHLRVDFHSDGSNNGRGFTATYYTSKPEECTDDAIPGVYMYHGKPVVLPPCGDCVDGPTIDGVKWMYLTRDARLYTSKQACTV